MASQDVTWQPKWVPLSILDFARIVHSFGDDSEALAKWTRQLADDLLFCNLNSKDQLTVEMLTTANEKYVNRVAVCKKAGKASAKARKQRQQNSAAPSSTSNGEENMHGTGNGVTLESGNNAANNKCMVAGNGNAPEDWKSATAMHTNLDGESESGDASEDVAQHGQPCRNVESGSSPSSTIEGAANGNNADVSANTLEDVTTTSASGNATTPVSTPTAISTDGPRQTENAQAEASAPSHGGSVAKNSALDMPGSGKASDPSGDNTANFPPSEGHEDGTNLNWHDIVQQSLGIAEGNDQKTEARESQTGAGAPPVRDPDCHNAPAPRFPRKSKPPKNAEEVRCFAADHAIDVDDARDWYEMNYVDRPGCDKDGVVIENWKGHCTAYCQTMAGRRKAG